MDNNQLIVNSEKEDEQLVCIADDQTMIVSKRFKVVKFITLLVLVLFLVLSLVLGRNEITVENLQYLFNYIKTDSSIYSYDIDEYKTINYSSYSNSDFSVFRNDFTVASPSDVTIYATNGTQILYSTEYFSYPKIMTNSTRMIVYDQQGNTYSIFNSFTRLFTGSVDYQITGGDISENGVYAFITKTAEYKSAVYIYQGEGEFLSRVLKNKYVMSVSLSDDGNKCYIASIYHNPLTGLYSSEIVVCNPYSGEIIWSTEIDGVMSLRVSAFDGGAFILTDRSLLVYSDSGDRISEYSYLSAEPEKFYFNDKHAFLSFNQGIDGSSSIIKCFDSKGELVCEKEVESSVTSMELLENDLYVLTPKKIYRTNIKNDNIEYFEYEGNCLDFVVTKTGIVYFCYPGYASAYGVENILEYTNKFSVN